MRKKNWSKSARSIGYSVEYDSVQFFKKQGIFAFRIPNKQQVGELSKIDGIWIEKGGFFQSKRRKKYLTKRDKELILYTRSKYPASNITCRLFWRDRGLKFEPIK